ncbi:MAG: hypothetical protein WD273_06985 [Trueperaceae bacterium]
MVLCLGWIRLSLNHPVTGDSVLDTWRAEQQVLQPLPESLLTPFDVQVTMRVSGDCLVRFEGREYAVPFRHVGRDVHVRGAPVALEPGGNLNIPLAGHEGLLTIVEGERERGTFELASGGPTPLWRLAGDSLPLFDGMAITLDPEGPPFLVTGKAVLLRTEVPERILATVSLTRADGKVAELGTVEIRPDIPFSLPIPSGIDATAPL